jgi:phage terminase small subunit
MGENGSNTLPRPSTIDGKPAKNPLELKLTRRQELFVREYMVDLDAKRAAIAVGYSERSADAIGRENIRKPHIRAVIDVEIAERAKRLDISAQAVIQELARIGFADMADYIEIDESGMIRALPLDTLAEGKSRIIKKVKEKRTIRTTKGDKDNPDGDQILDDTYEFELHDKVKSLELLAKHLGLLQDKTEVNVNVPITVEIVKFSDK